MEDIPGIGKAKAAQLITKFGSAKAILNIPQDELASAPGIGAKLAARIIEKLKEDIEGTAEI